jgi:flagellin-specific chaperone FliS
VREQPSWITDAYSPRTPFMASRPKLSSRLTEPLPYTPTRPYYFDEPYSQPKGLPRYPYTPDSSQILRRHTDIPTSPTPWDEYSDPSLSPIQDALTSCIAQFEDLIQSRQPDEDQMEYIVGQFEAMARHLSASESYAKETDAQILARSDQGIDIMQADDGKDDLAEAKRLYHQAYVAEVGNYVKSVQKYIDELRKRLDEVKTLNSIQLDVIEDLRKQMKHVRQSMREEFGRGSDRVGSGEEKFKVAQIVDLDEVGDGFSSKYSGEEAGNGDGCDGHGDDSTTREFGIDSWQTLVGEEEDVSQEIHNEYAKLVRSAVDSLTADDDHDLPVARPTKRRLITIIRTPPKRSFWASIGEALDAMSDLLLED